MVKVSFFFLVWDRIVMVWVKINFASISAVFFFKRTSKRTLNVLFGVVGGLVTAAAVVRSTGRVGFGMAKVVAGLRLVYVG